MTKSTSGLPFITVDESQKTPLHRQIYKAIRRAILAGDCRPMTKLPSTRFLAEHLDVSRTTVVNAYEQLLAEGYLEGIKGKGTFVSAHLPEEFLQTPRVEARKNEKSSVSRHLGFSDYGKKLFENGRAFLKHHGAITLAPFQNSVTAIDEFPFDVWARITQKLHKRSAAALFGYSEPVGFRPLREAIAAHLKAARGVKCTADQVVITGGTQQALDLISRIFLEKKSEVLIEDPCYLGARNIFSAAGAKIISVPVDKEGFDLQHARRKSSRARLVYVTPSHQYPLGITMSLVRRLHLLEWAGETDSFIIEDDYDSEYRYSGRPLPSLQGLDRDGRVIYLGTFSKTIFPALRLGCLVVPADLTEIFAAVRVMTDLHSPTIEQAVLAEFIGDGHFSRHLRRMRGIYWERQQILVSEVGKYLEGFLEITPAELGMDLIGWLPEGVSDREVSLCTKEMKLKTVPVSAYYVDQTNVRGGLFLGYTAFNEKQIKNGVRQLAKAVDLFIKKHPQYSIN